LNATDLPAVNATFNGLATILLLAGIVAIKRGRKGAHAVLMRSAFVASACFLAGYLYYHFSVQAELGPTPFRREGWIHTAYLLMLFSHIILAVANLPMVLKTFWLAHKQDWVAHKKLARWTFPIWLYVSVTGVLVYAALYHWNPAE
jgi:putative membrane protein